MKIRTNDVCDPVQYGSSWFTSFQDRRWADRFTVRRRFYAGDDARRRGRPSNPRRPGLCPLPPLGRLPSAARAPAQQQLAMQSTAHRYRPVPQHQRDRLLRERLRRQFPTRKEMFRSAYRLRNRPQRRLAGWTHARKKKKKSITIHPLIFFFFEI